jgi:hypothetical protein
MFWSTAAFELASENDIMDFPLRTLLSEGSSVVAGNTPLNATRYYDAKSNMTDLEPERWESM